MPNDVEELSSDALSDKPDIGCLYAGWNGNEVLFDHCLQRKPLFFQFSDYVSFWVFHAFITWR